jgi:antitoxin (DNA-binding transcriptional repressor) of toxin-antitoxin stability system
MISLEVNEFVECIDEMLRMVEEEGETIEITKQNETIAQVVPVRKRRQVDAQDHSAPWDELERISTEISAYWPQDLSAVDAVRDARQES